MARIAIVGGGGYVGLTYGAALAELGNDVTGLDTDSAKVFALSTGESPIFEPGLDDLLRRNLTNGRLRFTTDYADAIPDADFAFICVGTPPDSSGRADTRYIAAAAQAIGQHGRGHTIVVNKSTMPVGSVERVAEILREHAQADATFSVVANPEFLREGSALSDVFHPDRIVLGSTDSAAVEKVAELYASLNAPLLITDPRSAEMIKYASNSFLAAKISFINEVAMICEALQCDISAVSGGMGLDPRIGSRFLQAGVGFGGSCFPKDVRALASLAADAGMSTSMLDAVLDINKAMRQQVVDKLASHLGDVSGRTVALLGLAFKPDTDDIRESPAVEIAKQLSAQGAVVRATDPAALSRVASEMPETSLCEDAYAAAVGADAVVLTTEWRDYLSLDFERLANAMAGRFLLDGRNVLDPLEVTRAGLTYAGVGRSIPSVRIEHHQPVTAEASAVSLAAD